MGVGSVCFFRLRSFEFISIHAVVCNFRRVAESNSFRVFFGSLFEFWNPSDKRGKRPQPAKWFLIHIHCGILKGNDLQQFS